VIFFSQTQKGGGKGEEEIAKEREKKEEGK